MNTARSGIEQLRNHYFRAVDYWLAVPILTLTMIGLFVLNKVLSSGFDDYPGIFYRQAGAAVLGIITAIIICLMDTSLLKFIGWITYGVSQTLLFIVPFDGYSMADKWGADSWMKLPVIGNFQPSELSKIGLIIMAAYIFQEMSEKKITKRRGFLYLALLYAPPMVMILIDQKDFGTGMVIVFSFVFILFVWGLKYRYFFLAMSGGVIMIPVIWNFYFSEMQKKRILSLLFSGSDPSAEYNLIQSKMAIASGGLTGNHTGNIVYVPVKEADFIFAAVSEHLGFIGTTAVILLAFLFLSRCLYVAANSSQKAYSYIVIGMTAGLAFHFIENMGMCVGLLPITGIPLPFISLGGTALVVSFIGVGLIMNISMDRHLVQK